MMHKQRHGVRRQCYPSGNSKLTTIIGITLIAIGILLILLCVPAWAWLAAIGVALAAVGVILVGRGR